jgi:hypothetical protein
MKKLARRLTICAVLLMVVLGTTFSSNSVDTRAQDPHRNQACIDACNDEFSVCFFAAYPDRREMARCRAERQQCIADCK